MQSIQSAPAQLLLIRADDVRDLSLLWRQTRQTPVSSLRRWVPATVTGQRKTENTLFTGGLD